MIHCCNCNKVFYTPIGKDIESFVDNLSVNGCPHCSPKEKADKRLKHIGWCTKREMDMYELAQNGLIKSVFFDGNGNIWQ